MNGNKPNFEHPCFQNGPAHVARMHLPVAPLCNIKCSFCNPIPGNTCLHGCMPGLTSEVYDPSTALERLREVIEDRHIHIRIVGIAGPGEPLFNPETFEVLERIRRAYPQIHLCLSTNGLLLPDCVDRIAALGVETLTVTINSVSLPVARRVYEHVRGRTDDAAFEELMRNQLLGVMLAAKRGICVKVNSVLIPGENEDELPEIACLARERGAYIHNILPLIPRSDARRRCAPDNATMQRARAACGENLMQFECCRHCRADAIIDAT